MLECLTISVLCLFVAIFTFLLEGATMLLYIVLTIGFVFYFVSVAKYLKTL